jgi:peroxiredoxin Q/BCP
MKMDFKLPNKDGEETSYEKFKGKWLVLYFYPKDNTPGCTIEAIEFTKLLPEFKKLSCEIVGVSPDSEKSHCNFYDKHKLKLILLSDKDKELAKKLGAYGTKKIYGKEIEGIIRSTFLINPEGKIVKEWKNVKAAGHAKSVLEEFKKIQHETKLS